MVVSRFLLYTWILSSRLKKYLRLRLKERKGCASVFKHKSYPSSKDRTEENLENEVVFDPTRDSCVCHSSALAVVQYVRKFTRLYALNLKLDDVEMSAWAQDEHLEGVSICSVSTTKPCWVSHILPSPHGRSFSKSSKFNRHHVHVLILVRNHHEECACSPPRHPRTDSRLRTSSVDTRLWERRLTQQ